MENTQNTNKIKRFIIDVIKGVVMGAAFIIPGFSGGTVAVLLGIYNGFINAIAGIFKDFKKNILYLFPFAIGIAIGVLALSIPIKLGFQYVPLPLTCLFVGLMLGGMPPIIKDAGGKPKFTHIIALLLSAGFAVGICFIPGIGDMDMTNANVGNYFMIAGVGVLASGGCIVPGISGSMIAMIFGVYNDVIGAVSDIITFTNFAQSLFILLAFGVGIVVGFFSIALLMRFLLKKYKKGTFYAIIGFIIGSVYSIFNKQEMLINPEVSLPLQISLAVVTFAVGLLATIIFCHAVDKRKEINETLTNSPQDVD